MGTTQGCIVAILIDSVYEEDLDLFHKELLSKKGHMAKCRSVP